MRIVVYILAFPIVVLIWRIPKLLFRNWAVMVAFSPAIYSVLKTFRRSFIFGVAAIISAFVVCLWPTEPIPISICMSIVGLYLIFHYIQRFRAAFTTSTIFAEIHSKLTNSWDQMRHAAWGSIPSGDPNSDAYKNQFGQSLLNAYMFTTTLLVITKNLSDVSKSRKLDLYLLCSLVWTFGITVVAFGIIYFGLARIDPGSFSGLENPTLTAFIGYSFSTLMTSDVSLLNPASGLAQFFSFLQLFGSLLILVLLAFIILTSIRERYRNDLDELTNELRDAANDSATLIEQNFNLTVAAVEQHLLEYNEVTMKWLLQIRYGEDKATKIIHQSNNDRP
jgi:hypothetical protein